MTEISGLPGPNATPGGDNSLLAIPRQAISVETPPTPPAKAQRNQLPQPSGGSGTDNHGWGQSALASIYQNVGVDFGRIAALMMLIDSELAKAARDERVMQVEAVAEQMHAIADDIRTSANLALAGGVVSGAAQIGAGAISVSGGIKGMAITRVPSSATSGPSTPAGANGGGAAPTSPAPTAPDVATSTPPPASAGPMPDAAAPPTPTPTAPDAPAPPTPATPDTPLPTAPNADVPTASTAPDPTASISSESASIDTATTGDAPPAGDPQPQPGQPAATEQAPPELSPAERQTAETFLDHTVSQHLSAKAQNIALLTQGLSQLSTATGDIIKNVLEFEARQTDAHVKDTEAELEERRAHLERVKGFADTMQKGTHDLLQIFQQVEEGIHQTSRHIWSRA